MISRLAVLAERIAKLPVPTKADDWLAAYRKPPKPAKARRQAALPPTVEITPAPALPDALSGDSHAQPPGVLDF